MSNLIKLASAELNQMIINSLGSLVAEGSVPSEPVPAFKIEIPADKSHGDFASNAAMVCAKPFKSAPRKIAELICSKFDFNSSEFFERAEIAGPGFINFFLSRKWFSAVIKNADEEKNCYGRTDTGKGKKILVEFVSANPTGPMHIGNARGGAIGDCLASVLDWAGYTVEREFYINDAGNQIEKFGKSLSLRYMQLCTDEGQKIRNTPDISVEDICRAVYGEDGNKPEFPMPEDTYRGMDIIEHAENYLDENGTALSEADVDERRKTLVAYALPKNIAGLERDLKKYRIEYDTWFRESTLHKNGAVADVVKQLTEKGYTYEKEGAVWFKAEQFGADKDFVLVRANGIPTYVVPDIAYHYNKIVTRGFDKAIDIFGADHHGYVPRLKAALTALGADASKLDVILMQMVRLVRNGETVKLSKRSGKAITLVTLLDEIPIDAARFFFNLREANSHFEFDLDLAVEQSSQNPVYYVQYAHARICSIIRNIMGENPVFDISEKTGELLSTPQETELIRHIASFPNETDNAAKNYDPAKITKYTIELAALFHKFYDSCSVKNAETDELRNARLALCSAAGQTLKNALTMLKIDCPEKM